MKSLLAFPILILFCYSFAELKSQNLNYEYATVNVFNNLRQNPHDFIFSYDIINGNHTCNNNFTVVSKVNVPTSFRFRVYLNEVAIYTGQVAIPAFGRVFFDNAFLTCYSISNVIRVEIIP